MSDERKSGADNEQSDEESSRFGAIADRIADRRARSGGGAESTDDNPDEGDRDNHDRDESGSNEDDSDEDDSDESGSDRDDSDAGEFSADDPGGDDSEEGSGQPASEESPGIEHLTGRGTRALTLVDTGREDPWSFLGGESTLQEKHLLVVSVGEPSPSLRRVWEQTANGAGRRGLVQVGDVSPGAERYDERLADVVKRVPSRSNVSRLGIIVSQVATGFAKQEGETLVAIDSFTALAAQTTTQTLFRFGYLLESQFGSHGIHGFCGLAEGSHSAAELTTLAELFDVAVESTGNSFSVRQIGE